MDACSIPIGYGAMDIWGSGMMYVQLTWPCAQKLTLYSSFDAVNILSDCFRFRYAFWHVFMLNAQLYQESLWYLQSTSSACSLWVRIPFVSLHIQQGSRSVFLELGFKNTRGFVDLLSRYISWWRSVLGEILTGFSGGEFEGIRLLGKPRRKWVEDLKCT
jgi:hypothetical protein